MDVVDDVVVIVVVVGSNMVDDGDMDTLVSEGVYSTLVVDTVPILGTESLLVIFVSMELLLLLWLLSSDNTVLVVMVTSLMDDCGCDGDSAFTDIAFGNCNATVYSLRFDA
jgi:hypothetical protein